MRASVSMRASSALRLLHRRARRGFVLRAPRRPPFRRRSPPASAASSAACGLLRPAAAFRPDRQARRSARAISPASRSTSASWRASRSRRSAASRSVRSIWLRAAAASARSAVSLRKRGLARRRALAVASSKAAARRRPRARRRRRSRRCSVASSSSSRCRMSALSRDHPLLARDVGVELRDAACRARPGGRGCGRPPPRSAPGRSTAAGRRRRRRPRRRAVPAGDARRSPAPWRHPSARLARSATSDGRRRQRRLRLRLLRLGQRPAQMQQRRLGLADVGRQVLEARGLARLALQAFDLAFELADDVVEPFEVLLGGAQPQLGLVAAGVQAGNAGRLFEQRAARLRLGLDQLADAALPDHRGRAGAGRLVGEQQLHVLGARFLAVDAVDRAGLALDAARHLQFVGVVEGGGRGAVGIVEEQRDFGGVARRPRCRSRRRSRRPCRTRACSCRSFRPSPSAAPRRGWTCRSRSGRRRRSARAR